MDLQPNSPTLYKRAPITKKSNKGSFIKGNAKKENFNLEESKTLSSLLNLF